MTAWLKTISPLADRLSNYRREDFVGDLIAGLIVAVMLVPQAMAYVLEQIADRPDIKSVLLISSGINEIGSTGIEVLETIIRELGVNDIEFHMSDVKGPVTDRLELAGFGKEFMANNIFLSAHEAFCKLTVVGSSTGLTKQIEQTIKKDNEVHEPA